MQVYISKFLKIVLCIFALGLIFLHASLNNRKIGFLLCVTAQRVVVVIIWMFCRFGLMMAVDVALPLLRAADIGYRCTVTELRVYNTHAEIDWIW